MRRKLFFSALSLSGFLCLHAQDADINYDESKIQPYALPALLTSESGQKIANTKQWEEIRRPELLTLFTDQMFGKIAETPVEVSYKILDDNPDALGGKATRKQVEITFSKGDIQRRSILLMYLPNHKQKPVPVFLSPNFKGNQSVSLDPDIIPTSDVERGAASSRWPVEQIIGSGYGVITVHYHDFFPDRADGYVESILPLVGIDPRNDLAANDGQAISAWAWGLRRAMDYLQTDPRIDATKVILMGHSRLGKTALWAGALDTRFAIVISNDSGCGGAALSRRVIGENVNRINTVFPYWFCKNFHQYNNNEAALPFDQHQLIALIAPRPVYVASAEEDQWADPKGEYLGAYHAGEIYRLYGLEGLPTNKQPAVGSPIMTHVGYHIRSGIHDVTAYDWENYIKFADKWIK